MLNNNKKTKQMFGLFVKVKKMKQMFLTTGKDLDFLGIKWCPTKACNYHCSYCVQKNDDKKEVRYDKLVINLSNYDMKVNGVSVDTPPKE